MPLPLSLHALKCTGRSVAATAECSAASLVTTLKKVDSIIDAVKLNYYYILGFPTGDTCTSGGT